MDDLQQLVQKLQNTRHLEKEEWAALIRGRTDILAAEDIEEASFLDYLKNAAEGLFL